MKRWSILFVVMLIGCTGIQSDIANEGSPGIQGNNNPIGQEKNQTQNVSMCTDRGCTDGITITIPELILSHPFAVSLNNLTYDSCVDQVTATPIKRFGDESVLSIIPGDAETRDRENTVIRVQGGAYESIELLISMRNDCASEPVVVIDEVFSPEYHQFAPNGPDCSPLCRQANVNLSLS